MKWIRYLSEFQLACFDGSLISDDYFMILIMLTSYLVVGTYTSVSWRSVPG